MEKNKYILYYSLFMYSKEYVIIPVQLQVWKLLVGPVRLVRATASIRAVRARGML